MIEYKMQLIGLLVSFLVFTAYLYEITTKFGILRSVSASAYAWRDEGRNKPIWFTLAMWFTGFPMLLLADWSRLVFLIATGLGFTGVAWMARSDKVTEIVHIIGATLSIAVAMLIMASKGLFIFPICFVVLSLMMLGEKNKIFFIEIIAFYISAFGFLILLMGK